jgi:hypothetical protein
MIDMLMENLSLKSDKEIQNRINKMRKWKKPTYEQMMEYLYLYSEISFREGEKSS